MGDGVSSIKGLLDVDRQDALLVILGPALTTSIVDVGPGAYVYERKCVFLLQNKCIDFPIY